MRILINDMIQYSDAPVFLKSPALADDGTVTTLVITLAEATDIDCIGIGNTNATSITVNGEVVSFPSEDIRDQNGLYILNTPLNTDTLTITLTGGDTLGRFAAGKSRQLGAAPAREPGFWSTNNPRVTLSGQVVSGIGGIVGREIQVDFRYKFDKTIFDDIEDAYSSQIGKGYPFFIDFTGCGSCRYPWKRLYGTTDINWMFQSSVSKFLYSKKLKFKEAF